MPRHAQDQPYTVSLKLTAQRRIKPGFTIVELLVVIVVIAILAAISVLAYNGIQNRATGSALQSDLRKAATQLSIDSVENGSYPSSKDQLPRSSETEYEYDSDGESYCLTATSPRSGSPVYHVSQSGVIASGPCTGHSGGQGDTATITDGSHMQQVTSANCPSTRTRAVDARDNRTYWVQELSDSKCWMLTNLAYTGGGSNTYGDVRTLAQGGALTYTAGHYYPTPGANPTTEPASPSTSTNGSGQYGYLYNWCGAMGVQLSTSACAEATTPAPDVNISVCAAGWRLPSSAELHALNAAVNSGSTSSDAGLLTNWLGQRSGYWNGSFNSQGSLGDYWSSSQVSASAAYELFFNNVNVTPNSGGFSKRMGFAVRCVAS